ncbi:MAG: hypothetical protein AB7P21_07110 [Lautropia sp.]
MNRAERRASAKQGQLGRAIAPPAGQVVVCAVVDPRHPGAGELLVRLFGRQEEALRLLEATPRNVRGPLLFLAGYRLAGVRSAVVTSADGVLGDAVHAAVAMTGPRTDEARWHVLADDATTALVAQAIASATGLEILQ